MDFIRTIEEALGVKAEMNMMPIQPGDMLATFANIDSLAELADFKPTTLIKEGIHAFVDWYREYDHDGKRRHDCGHTYLLASLVTPVVTLVVTPELDPRVDLFAPFTASWPGLFNARKGGMKLLTENGRCAGVVPL